MVKLPDSWSRSTPLFDEDNLVSCARLVSVVGLAERAGLSELIGGRVTLDGLESTRVASAAVNPAGKLTSIIAGIAAGADCIDDLDVIRSGGMPRLFRHSATAPAGTRTPLQIELMQAFARTVAEDTTEGIHLAQSRLEALPMGQGTTMIGDLAHRVLEPVSAAELKQADVSAYRELLAQSSVKELTA